MFKKILIANRGEIACRVIKTAQQDGHRDGRRLFRRRRATRCMSRWPTRRCISARRRPRSPISLIDKIIAACKQTGAEAVHPGYGFLSERAAFAEALQAAGIVFIGPNPRAIEAMGDKIESKKFADGRQGHRPCPAISA